MPDERSVVPRDQWRFANETLIDYLAMVEKFGPLDFGEFVALSREAEAIAVMAVEMGIAVEDVPLIKVD
jgi:hypothetical protein